MRQIYAPKAVFDEALELIDAGNPRAAEAVCREAVERNPKDVNMLGLLGAVLVKMRRPEQAIKAYHDCISVKPNNGETYWSLANLKTYRFSDEQLQEMENRVEDGTGATDKSEVNFLFALGKAYDDRHDYDRAWHYYERGNDKQRMLVQYDPVHTETINDAIIEVFDRKLFEEKSGSGQTFAYDLTDIGEYYLQYQRMMDHWHEVLPDRVLTVQYEEVVTDFDNQVRRILDYCRLPWEENCIKFYETERPVRTASSEQVRQPIYTGALSDRLSEKRLWLLQCRPCLAAPRLWMRNRCWKMTSILRKPPVAGSRRAGLRMMT